MCLFDRGATGLFEFLKFPAKIAQPSHDSVHACVHMAMESRVHYIEAKTPLKRQVVKN